MTNAQKWIASFLGLFLVLFILVKVTKKEDAVDSSMSSMNGQTSEPAANKSDGLSLMQKNGCVTCHGAELGGTNMAPGLAGLREFWDREKLINYLRNPSSYGTDPRFVVYKQKYKNVMMPSYDNIEIKDLGKIADYLISR